MAERWGPDKWGVVRAPVSVAVIVAVFGLGVVELALTGTLIAAGGEAAPVAAAVLVYRALTYLPPILFGVPAYLVWRLTRHPEAVPDRAAVTVGAPG